jgi:tight adherence protein C
MTSLDRALLISGSTALLVGLAGLAFDLARRPPAPRPRFGNRGLQRARAISRRISFALIEPAIRYLAARLSGLWPRFLGPRVSNALTQSGDYLGLSEDELIAVSVASAVAFGGLGLLICPFYGLPPVSAAAAVLLGGPDEPIVEELQRVLQELDLGCTRRSAMNGLALRVPSDEVRELVNSVLQAEDKGSPLARVLTIQAQTLRLRRSVAAEEMAAEAALMLVGPMTLIFLCVIVLLLGPVVVRVMTGGFESP